MLPWSRTRPAAPRSRRARWRLVAACTDFRSALLVCLTLLTAPTGCFESGPLGLGADANGGPDTTVVPDTWTPTDPGAPPTDPGVVPTDPGPPPDPGQPDTGAAVSCIVDEQCTDVEPPDACAGQMRCIDYLCQPDPATAVSCPDPGDPCLETACNPATGQCETQDTCVCAPVGQLSCLAPIEISTSDGGATTVLDGYACGPQTSAAGAEHVWTFSLPGTQTVKIEAEASASGGLWVVGYDGKDCNPAACVAGGESAAAFQAIGGYKYAVAFEHADEDPVAVTLTATCDVQDELDCEDGVDDDLDGLLDCADPICIGVGDCPEATETDCEDDVDNDADGATDCADPECDLDSVCLQPCQAQMNVYCGFSQGLSTGGGKTDSTDYVCGPPAAGKEVVYKFSDNFPVTATVTLTTGVFGMGLYAMKDQGLGCTPKHCFDYSTTSITFASEPGVDYYLAVDAPEGVQGAFGIAIDCP